MAYYTIDAGRINASKTVCINDSQSKESHVEYIIQVTVGIYQWTVQRRYSEFYDLHEKMVAAYKLEKNLLPPKKLFGNQSQAFIKKRQSDLEIYLQLLLHHLRTIPIELANFLEFDHYEIHGITQDLAEQLYSKGDDILQSGELYHITPLQLYAVTERLKLAEPTCEGGDPKRDIGHILDFLQRLKYLKVCGSKESLGTSNINMCQIPFDLSHFRILSQLQLTDCNPTMIRGLEQLKKTLNKIHVHHSVSSIQEVLLCDVTGAMSSSEGSSVQYVAVWNNLVLADFSHNTLTEIDESVKLMQKVEILDLSSNQLCDIQHLENLSSLIHLDLSHNSIRHLDALHRKLGNIRTLNLTGNKLTSIHGFSKLYSLVNVDLSNNEIELVVELRHLSQLPCLESVIVSNNPVTYVVDYRTKVLEMFTDRLTELTLDKRKPTQKELDTVAILKAIQKAKEQRIGKRPNAMKKAGSSQPAEIADTASGSRSSSDAVAGDVDGGEEASIYHNQQPQDEREELPPPPADTGPREEPAPSTSSAAAGTIPHVLDQVAEESCSSVQTTPEGKGEHLTSRRE